MYRLQIRQLVIIRVDAGAEEEARVPPVDDLGHVAELDEVGLVFLVAGGDEAVYLGDRQSVSVHWEKRWVWWDDEAEGLRMDRGMAERWVE
jgi:hypothetical protein